MGDADGIDEHPALNGDRLPEGPMVSASLMPYSSRMEELRQGFQMATTFVTLGLDMAAKSNPKPEVRTMVKGLSGLMPRIAAIIQHVDFLEDGVSYSQVRDEGRALYARTTTRYRAPEDRPHFPRR
jgi:hypothetical protein